MGKSEDFKQHLEQGYTFKGNSIILGTGILDNEPISHAQVKIPIKTLNRHGLAKNQPIPSAKTKGKPVQETSIIDELSKNTMVRQLGRTIFRELTRGILGSFSGSKRR